jgi:peroxiredoxin
VGFRRPAAQVVSDGRRREAFMSRLLGWCSAAALCAASSTAWAIDIGEKAPPLEVTEWIQGEPVVLDQLVGKKIVVVEFWATWCAPCKESIPHLCKLAEKFKANVEIVGVSDEKPDEVREFAKDGKFKYRVACDDNRNTHGAYMDGVPGIPHAFVIDLQGDVAWGGHPMGLDSVIEKLVAGKWDVARAKEAAAARKDLQKLVMEQAKDPDQFAAAADKILAADPTDAQAFDIKCSILHGKKNDKGEKDVAGYKAFVSQLLPKLEGDWRALNNVAWKLATDDVLWRDAVAAFKAAKKAVELSQGKESDALDTFARVLFEAGCLDQAIDMQKKAVALDDKAENLKKVLAYYESCVEVRKQAGGPTPPKKK